MGKGLQKIWKVPDIINSFLEMHKIVKYRLQLKKCRGTLKNGLMFYRIMRYSVLECTMYHTHN